MSMYDQDFEHGMVVAIILLTILAAAIWGICALAGSYNNASHRQLGTLGHACFANRTCRTEKPMVCQDDGSESGVCVKK